ncbi:type II toxin-antitoxin system VapC family toxin [Aquisphaera insulae]|uniref:type II toxin-antitoxin system VapC family toxin n=1 Tax=Aquisphaera insulae TaxID=2712864 RepID=UPI0013ECEC1C|nr:type II toxin-antitoxin system VapC family toxin [Aquisphaera insulae]
MRLLLDTHAMYWYVDGSSQLSETARSLIQDLDSEVLISPASYWEIAIKVSIGKLTLNRPYEDFLGLVVNDYGFRILPIEPAHTVFLSRMPFVPGHKDPFDRLLAAQAIVEQIPIVSVDLALDAYGVTRFW